MLHVCPPPSTPSMDTPHAQLELASKERAAAAAAAERGALKADLEAVLRQRGALDSLRQLMVSALGRSRGAEGEAQA